MHASPHLEIVLVSAALLLGPLVITSPVRGGDYSPRFRAQLQPTLEMRRERQMAKLERKRAVIRAWQERQRAYQRYLDSLPKSKRDRDDEPERHEK
jgi:hypothetical protein